ncbi:MAG: PEP-CTERM sorting domain-containing protein [Hyphomonadaceae bacterium]
MSIIVRSALCSALVAAFAVPAHSITITQWNFNGSSAGTTSPSTGIGSLATIGGVTSSFGSGETNGGSSDPVVGSPPDFGLQTTGYVAQGTANKSAGIQANVSTVGFTNIKLNYDLRHSNTSSRYEQVQYTVNGTTWVDIASFDGNAGDTWFNNRTVALPAFADNLSAFGVRVVSAFAPGTSGYGVSNSTSTYATTGTWRFDMVTVSGDAIAAVVPVPGSFALLATALLGFGAFARRSRAG